LSGQPAGRQNQPVGRAGLNFFEQCQHPFKTLVGILFERKSPAAIQVLQNLVSLPVFSKFGNPQQLMSVNSDPDAQLMLRVKAGDSDAFAELVDKYKQPVMNLVYRILRDATEAEDLAQNVFLQVHKSAHRYHVSAKFSTWLFTIARNLCLNEIRRRTRHPADSLEATYSENDDQPARQFEDNKVFSAPDTILQQELEQKVELVLSELPENQRTALLLCRQDEMSYEEIAEVIGCSLSATKSLIHRGRETLKQKLKPYLRTGDWRNASK
jgi:RNA polymerase sigma-70 factor, ECF subfamily